MTPTTMSMYRFLYMRKLNLLNTNATWRAYDIVSAIAPRHIQAALKALGFSYAGELALRHFMALYEVPDETEAREVLGAWWLLTQIEAGKRLRVPLRALGAMPLAGEGLPPP